MKKFTGNKPFNRIYYTDVLGQKDVCRLNYCILTFLKKSTVVYMLAYFKIVICK